MNKKTEEFVGLLTEENAVLLADYILEIFGNTGEEPNPVKVVEYDFKMSYGVMQTDKNVDKSKAANTSFSFDFPKDHFGKKIVDLMGDEETENTEEVINKFTDFLKNVKANLEANKQTLREKITKAVLKTGPVVKHVDIKDIALTDLPSIDWVLSVKKLIDPKAEHVPVSGDIMQEFLKTGEEPSEILKRRKAEGDPRYEYVESVDKRKSFYECDVVFFVDYSTR